MLSLTVDLVPEQWDEINEVFIPPKQITLQLEHSLVSISKWESKWHKAFLFVKEFTNEEVLDYIKCMTVNKGIPKEAYDHLTSSDFQEIFAYINEPMTATTFRNDQVRNNNKKVVTSEVIYYWMVTLGIPMECQKWHLNRLLTLIRVCEIKNNPDKKMTMNEVLRNNAALNAARRKKLNSRG